MRRIPVATALVVGGSLTTAAIALGATVGPVTIQPAAAGPGAQTDPHISGTVVAYTNAENPGDGSIAYVELVSGTGGQVPAGTNSTDLLSDVSGPNIAFIRSFDNTGVGDVYVYNTVTGSMTVIDELAVTEGTEVAIGGTIVAFEETSDGVNRRILAADITDPDTTWVIDGTGTNFDPSVSADGSAIAYTACDAAGTNCQAMVATAADGWASTSLGASDSWASNIDTNGTHVVFVSGGDLTWASLAGGATTSITASGTDSNPNISGTFVVYEHSDGTQTDLYVVDISSDDAPINITNTPGISEQLSDISVVGTTLRVVYAAPSPEGTSLDIYVATAQIIPTAPIVLERNDCNRGGHSDLGFDSKAECKDAWKEQRKAAPGAALEAASSAIR